MVRFFLLLAALCYALMAKAQLDTIGVWRFGVSGLITINEVVSNTNTKPALGAGIGLYAHFETDECHNYYISLARTANPFLIIPPGYENSILIQRTYFTLLAERGTRLTPFFRLQYGVHLALLSNIPKDNAYWAKMRPMDVGVNAALIYFSTEQISLGVRYKQGFLNLVDNYPGDRRINGLNSQLLAVFNFRLF